MDKKTYAKEYWKKNRERLLPVLRERYHRLKRESPNFMKERNEYIKGKLVSLRKEVLKQYGGCCACCGEKTFEFLAIDHINGGGKEHRRTLKNPRIVTWLRQNKYPKGFQVLCHNCNSAKSFYGGCPHKKYA